MVVIFDQIIDAVMRFLAIAVLLLLFAGCDSHVEPEPDPLAERSYTVSIERIASNEHEFHLIDIAEANYPPRDSLLVWINPEYHHIIPEEKYWWWAWFDGVYVPWTITQDAVNYYVNLIDSMESGKAYQFITKAELEYRAEIRFESSYTFEGLHPMTNEPLPSVSFEDVYVIEMSLKWFQYCGPVCAMWVDHERIVVLNERGAVLGSFLDIPRPIAVS